MFEYITSILFSTVDYIHFISFGFLVLAAVLPISEDLILIVSASIAATKVPENTFIIFCGCVLGAYTSDIISYCIGKYAGPKILKTKFLKRIFPEQKRLILEVYFNRYGRKTLFFGRFIPFGFRNAIFMTSGLVNLKISKFLLIDFAALMITSTILYSLGYYFGKNYNIIYGYITRYNKIFFGIIVLIIFYIVIRKYKAHRYIKMHTLEEKEKNPE